MFVKFWNLLGTIFPIDGLYILILVQNGNKCNIKTKISWYFQNCLKMNNVLLFCFGIKDLASFTFMDFLMCINRQVLFEVKYTISS